MTPESELLERVDRLLRGWLLTGLVLSLALPAARGYHLWIGWLPYWLLLAPALSLALLHRRRLWPAEVRRTRPLRPAVRRGRRRAGGQRGVAGLLQVALRG